MASGLLIVAVGDAMLRGICEEVLGAAGWPVIPLDNPVDLIRYPELVHCDAVIVDDSLLGRETVLASRIAGLQRVIGLGLQDDDLEAVVDLPFTPFQLVSALGEPPPPLFQPRPTADSA